MDWSESNRGVWVFGYGSLVWNPGFEYKRSLIGHIKGFERRFWQGNATQRGTPEKPGRVATLVGNKDGTTWGRAFLLVENTTTSSLSYLKHRESSLGGYITTIVDFQPRDSREGPQGMGFPVLIYTATEHNPYYLGPASTHKLADEISTAKGTCGTNTEYVLKLADFMRIEIPGVWDDHLHSLEKELRRRLVGDNKPTDSGFELAQPDKPEVVKDEELTSQTTSGYSSQVKKAKLKCVNIL